MPSYSSDQLFQDWRYAVDEDFVTVDGEPFAWAENGKLQWGNEDRKISFDAEPHDGCVSDDGKFLAVAVRQTIHVIDTKTWTIISVLNGHTSRISGLAFKPGDSNTLISSEEYDYGYSDRSADPTVIVWDIDKAGNTPMPGDSSLREVSKTSVAAASDHLQQLGVHLKENELQALRTAFLPALSKVMAEYNVADNIRIHGRLHTGFQSETFSPSGKQMVYLPGSHPRSNSNAAWDIVICSTNNYKDIKHLKGHTDAIMWTGWSPDETLFASVSWDESVRIWDATQGGQIYVFKTNHQNWTGAFSPGSNFFAFTDGSGAVSLYEISSGHLHWKLEAQSSDRWRRAVAWHPDGKLLAVAGETCGEILLLDVDKKKVVQKRMLSMVAVQVDNEELRPMLKGFIGVNKVKFVDRGHKLAAWVFGDGSIEVFDISRQVKWRFARGGTEDSSEVGKWRDDDGKVTSQGGNGMLVWEQKGEAKIVLASLDFDAVRIWTIPMTEDRDN